MIARENNEKKALQMWKEWVEWRLEYKPEFITELDIKNELKTGKAFLHGFDNEGRPCIIIKNSRHIPEETDFDEFMRFFIYLIEKSLKLADE
jgi:hypothetical protein